mmetsp:Transcript_61749/g.143675  ORF Transcript_61749/g.143675 Transcript_61749/m.143675 type:complete len:205 (+) Transcript_61749:854-1468(+)
MLSVERHLAMEGQLAASPHEVAQSVVLLVVVPLGVLQPRLPYEADVWSVHPSLLITLDVLVAIDDELHLVALVREHEPGNGVEAGHGVFTPLPVRVSEPQAVGDNAIVAQPAAEHAGASVVSFGIGSRGAEGPSRLPGRVSAFGLADVKGLVAFQQRDQLLQLFQTQRWFCAAKLGQGRLEGLAQGRVQHACFLACRLHGSRKL